jgi:hypothetical protein
MYRFDYQSPSTHHLYEITLHPRGAHDAGLHYDISAVSLTRKRGRIDERVRGHGEVHFAITREGTAAVRQALTENRLEQLAGLRIFQHLGAHESAPLPITEFLR